MSGRRDSAIEVHGLGKRYRVGERERYLALRDLLARAAWMPFGLGKQKPDYLWALRDVNLQVQESEVVGLVGRNGAGKSTLLKILARITRPTNGFAEVRGRVGSLLEVGTGFHPELTGRENVYLSGAILGMQKAEIERKFDEIVAFAEVERFLDTPLKHYSSGMQMRLAFAVAAHLEPEILLVDEVLAVGDLRFQRKCLGKMGDVAKAGRTIIFVSHQMNQIRRLCERAIWIDNGSVRMDGATGKVLAAYESQMLSSEKIAPETTPTGRKARFLRWEVSGASKEEPNVISDLGEVTIRFWLEIFQSVEHAEHGIALYSADRQLMWGCAVQNLTLDVGRHVLSHTFPHLPLKPGPYQWLVTLWDGGEMLDWWDGVPDLNVATEVHQHHRDEWSGVLNVPTSFSHQVTNPEVREITIG